MKKFSVLLLISILGIFTAVQNPSDAIVISANNVQNTKTYTKSMPYYNYLKFYTIENDRVQIHFNKMNNEVEKNFVRNLTKEEKQDYKYTKKIQQLIDKGAWGEVLYKYPNFYPALVQYYNNCIEKELYEEALRTMDKIRMADRNYQIFSKNTINDDLGRLYMKNNQYQKALDVYKLYENTGDEKIYSSMAKCYYGIGDYQNAINYIGRIRNRRYEDNELLYTIYSEKNDLPNAHRIAIALNNQKYNFENLMRIQKTSQNDTDRLKYAYQARNTTMNEGDIAIVNEIIANLEQKKIDKQLSKLKIFVKAPKWEYFRNQLPENITAAELCQKQDEFFRTANQYLIKYDGQQLTNAFYSLNQDYMNYVLAKKEQYYREKQQEAEQIMLEMQAQQQYINEQLIQQQRMQNYVRMQRIQNLGNQSYYMNPAVMYDPFW
ncbi:hypothetical protein J6O86_04855 [bacterium]|nr:hypothetical protein [bacterium]